MEKIQVNKIISELTRKIRDISSIEDLEKIRIEYLSRAGLINNLSKKIKVLSEKERSEYGRSLNELKQEVSSLISKEQKNLQSLTKKEKVDLTTPVVPTKTGNLHPITLVTNELNQFFHYYGFSIADEREIEDDFHNFEMMGVPKDHQARELQDTLYIKEPNILLRTQTSSVEARYLEKFKPPIRIVCPGKVFRNETANKSNGSLFHQYQAVYVNKNVHMGHLKWMFTKALKFILGEDTEIRFRSKYYPEVEPGLSPDIKCTFCNGKGCDVCKQRGWIEIAGGGIIHPNTLKYANIDYKTYSGLAFGWGLDRVAMARFNIKDIRLLYNGSIVYK